VANNNPAERIRKPQQKTTTTTTGNHRKLQPPQWIVVPPLIGHFEAQPWPFPPFQVGHTCHVVEQKKKNASNKDDTGCKGYPLCSKQREGIEGIIVMVKIENRVRQSNGALKHNMGIVSR
jgi:hypothetical protein